MNPMLKLILFLHKAVWKPFWGIWYNIWVWKKYYLDLPLIFIDTLPKINKNIPVCIRSLLFDPIHDCENIVNDRKEITIENNRIFFINVY